ncbi:nitroreductase family protein [bacterium]|nr:nitroreductase family protein [bacterium]
MGSNPFISICRKRRSVRKFSDRPVTDEELSEVLDAARLSPSSNNTQPWRFIIIREPKRIKAISGAAPALVAFNKPWMSKAPCLLVCCAEPGQVYHKTVGKLLTVDLATIDIAIAIEHVVLASAEMGLGTCWVGWFSEKKLRGIIDLPDNWKVISILAVGWPKEELTEHEPKRKALSDIAFDEGTDSPFGQRR